MTEAETIASMNDIANVAGSFVSVWVSFTFAYLTVAYFLGKVLSRFQCLMISGLYGVTAAYFGCAAAVYVQAWHVVRLSRDTLYNSIWLMTFESAWVWAVSVFLFAGTTISLYFMYDVRRRNRTNNDAAVS